MKCAGLFLFLFHNFAPFFLERNYFRRNKQMPEELLFYKFVISHLSNTLQYGLIRILIFWYQNFKIIRSEGKSKFCCKHPNVMSFLRSGPLKEITGNFCTGHQTRKNVETFFFFCLTVFGTIERSFKPKNGGYPPSSHIRRVCLLYQILRC